MNSLVPVLNSILRKRIHHLSGKALGGQDIEAPAFWCVLPIVQRQEIAEMVEGKQPEERGSSPISQDSKFILPGEMDIPPKTFLFLYKVVTTLLAEVLHLDAELRSLWEKDILRLGNKGMAALTSKPIAYTV